MSTKTKHRAVAASAPLVRPHQVQPHQVQPRPAPRRQVQRRRIPWLPVAIGLVLVGALAVLLWGAASTPRGTVAATTKTHDFGQVPISGGYLTAKFPLTVEGAALVTDITST